LSRLRTHYDNLKVSRDAPDFVIRAAYKTLCQKYHPDKNPEDAQAGRIMGVINRSYEVLSDPGMRAEHDAWIVREELKLASQTSRQAGEVPIPPGWRQPAPPQPTSETALRRRVTPLGIVTGLLIGLDILLDARSGVSAARAACRGDRRGPAVEPLHTEITATPRPQGLSGTGAGESPRDSDTRTRG